MLISMVFCGVLSAHRIWIVAKKTYGILFYFLVFKTAPISI
jgi:hypothetical protein